MILAEIKNNEEKEKQLIFLKTISEEKIKLMTNAVKTLSFLL